MIGIDKIRAKGRYVWCFGSNKKGELSISSNRLKEVFLPEPALGLP